MKEASLLPGVKGIIMQTIGKEKGKTHAEEIKETQSELKKVGKRIHKRLFNVKHACTIKQ